MSATEVIATPSPARIVWDQSNPGPWAPLFPESLSETCGDTHEELICTRAPHDGTHAAHYQDDTGATRVARAWVRNAAA